MPKKEYRHIWTDWTESHCECDIRIFDGCDEESGKIIVIATDLNIGNSVMNQVEEIGTAICEKENIDPQNLVLIEHHAPSRRRRFDETFDLVILNWHEGERKFKGVDWKHTTKEQTERIIGESLP